MTGDRSAAEADLEQFLNETNAGGASPVAVDADAPDGANLGNEHGDAPAPDAPGASAAPPAKPKRDPRVVFGLGAVLVGWLAYSLLSMTGGSTPAPAPSPVAAVPTTPPAAVAATPATATGPASAGESQWQPTDAGINQRVDQLLSDDLTKPPQADIGASIDRAPLVMSTAKAPGEVVPADPLKMVETDTAAILAQGQATVRATQEVEQLKASLDEAAQRELELSTRNAELADRVSSLEGSVRALTEQMNRQAAEVDALRTTSLSAKPDLVIRTIAIAPHCETCVARAVVEIAGEVHTLTTGDTFAGYAVDVSADRVVLSNDRNTFSYFAVP